MALPKGHVEALPEPTAGSTQCRPLCHPSFTVIEASHEHATVAAYVAVVQASPGWIFLADNFLFGFCFFSIINYMAFFIY